MKYTFFFLPIRLVFSTLASSDTEIMDQIQWLRSKGGYFNEKIMYGSYDEVNPSSKGMFASALIKDKEEIMVIPVESLITGGPDEDMCQTAKNLVREYHLGKESNYEPYVRYLFESFPHNHLPLAWSDKAKTLFRNIIGDDLEPSDFGEHTFEHICEDNDELVDKELLHAAFRIVVSRGWEDTLVPVLDMLDHRNGRFHNVDQANSVHGSQDISIIAIRDIAAGEQLYYSYNECHDVDCEGIDESYTTPQIFADYGFLEQYPRRFHFNTNYDNVIIEIDVDNRGEAILDWISCPINVQTKNWFRGNLRRLHQLNSTILQGLEDLEASNERKSILEYYGAIVIALELVASSESSTVDNDQVCTSELNHDKVCMEGNVYSDRLEEIPDPLQYHGNICDGGGITGDKVSSDVVKSSYQTIEFSHYYDVEKKTKDTCLYLEGWLQTCTSFRPHYHEWLVHYPASFVKDVKRVLFLGGGDNMILHEVLKYPNLELVVGMELDQQVVRSSFKNMGIQPHFDKNIVQWWFGDATKSLQMLPTQYYGTFDIVIVDLQTYVIESLMVTADLNVLDFVTRFLKPNGVLSQNEDFVPRTSTDFAKYTIDLEFNDIPVLCQQSINIGSDAVDFSRKVPIDHGIETLVYNVTAAKQFHNWWNYRRNNPWPRNQANESINEEGQSVPDTLNSTQGLFLVLEIEDVTESAKVEPFSNIFSLVQKALELEDLTVLSMSSFQSEAMFILMREGYVVVRPKMEFKYFACDLYLWEKFHKQGTLVSDIVRALGGHSSAFRIVTSGMTLNSTVANQVSFQNASPAADYQSMGDKSRYAENKHLATLLNAMVSFLHLSSDNSAIAVICAKDINSCDSLEILRNIGGSDIELLPIKSCTSEESAYRDIACEMEVVEAFQLHNNKFSGIIIDPSVPFKMGQVLHTVLSNKKNQDELLADKYLVLAPNPRCSDKWRTALMERFRTEIVRFSPAFHADISMHFTDTKESICSLSIFSTGDGEFYTHLVGAIKKFESEENITAQLNFVKDGLLNYIPSFEPTRIATETDYDRGHSIKQWENQHPIGLQSLFQFEPEKSLELLKRGSKVLAKFEDSFFTGKWYRGIVLAAHDDGTYDINFDDGDKLSRVKRSLIRKWEKHREISVSDKVLTKHGDEDAWHQGAVLDKLSSRLYKVHIYDGKGTISVSKKKNLIRQVEDKSIEASFSISSHLLENALKNAIAAISSIHRMIEAEVKSQEGIGNSNIITTAFWTEGNAIITYDGGTKNVVLNLATYGSKSEKHQLFLNVFLESLKAPLVLVSHNRHPRGFGRVVNFKHELKSSKPNFL